MNLPGVKSYPKEVYVRGCPWRVKFVSKVPGGPDNIGLCDPSDKTIYVKLKQTKHETFKTFFHEVLHAIEDEYCLQLPHSAYIERTENAILALLFENFDFIVKFIEIMSLRNIKQSD